MKKHIIIFTLFILWFPVLAQQWRIQKPFTDSIYTTTAFIGPNSGNEALMMLPSIRTSETISDSILTVYFNGSKIDSSFDENLHNTIQELVDTVGVGKVGIYRSRSKNRILYGEGYYEWTVEGKILKDSVLVDSYHALIDSNGMATPLFFRSHIIGLGYNYHNKHITQVKDTTYLVVFYETEHGNPNSRVYDLAKIVNRKIEIIKWGLTYTGPFNFYLCQSDVPINVHNYQNKLVVTAATNSFDSTGKAMPLVSIFEVKQGFIKLGENQIANGGCLSLEVNGDLYIGGYEEIDDEHEFIEGENLIRLRNNLWMPVGTNFQVDPFDNIYLNEVTWLNEGKGQLFMETNYNNPKIFRLEENGWKNINPSKENYEGWEENLVKGQPTIMKDKVMLPIVMADNWFSNPFFVLGMNIENENNTAPVAIDDTVLAYNRVSKFVNPRLNDLNPDGDYLYVRILDSAKNGGLTQLNNESLLYTAHSTFAGKDTFNYEICDVQGLCDTAKVFLNVEFYNTAPIGVNDTIQLLNTKSSTQIYPLHNDYDNEGDSLFFQLVSSPKNGSIVVEGETIRYVQGTTGISQVDSFSYKVCDQFGACSLPTQAIIKSDSQLTSNSTIVFNPQIALYPNPTNVGGEVFVYSQGIINSVELMSLNGQVVKNEQQRLNSNQLKISTSNLSSGIYLLKIQFQDGIALRKLVVN